MLTRDKVVKQEPKELKGQTEQGRLSPAQECYLEILQELDIIKAQL